MSPTTERVPERYQPDPRAFEDKDWLYEQYWGDGKSAQDIAEDCGVSDDTIFRWMKRHGMPRRRCSHRQEAGAYDPRTDFAVEDTTQNHVDWSGYER